MINKFLLLIVKGLLTVLPITLTVYLLVWVITSIEAFLHPYLTSVFYFPGLGIIITLLTLAAIGLLINAYIVQLALDSTSLIFEKLSVVKTLYGAIRDAVALFETNKTSNKKRAVLVELAPEVHTLGFITNDKVSKKLFPNEHKIVVYLPLSYQIGGYTLYVNPDKITELDIDVETAMRIAITGGNSIQSKKVVNSGEQ